MEWRATGEGVGMCGGVGGGRYEERDGCFLAFVIRRSRLGMLGLREVLRGKRGGDGLYIS